MADITENNSVDLLKEPQDVSTTLSHFCFLSLLLWCARGSPGTPHFPLYRIRSFCVSLKKNSSKSYLQPSKSCCNLIPQSVTLPVWEVNLTSLLIHFTSAFATAIDLSKVIGTRPWRWEHHAVSISWLPPCLWPERLICDLPAVILVGLIVADGAIELKIIQNKTEISNWDQSVKPTEQSASCSQSQLSTSHWKCTSKGQASEGEGKEMW